MVARPREWLPLVRWRAVIAIAAALAIGGVLFAWRTWYYTGVFGLFHGTQREFLAVWKPGMTLAGSGAGDDQQPDDGADRQDPPRFALHAAPLVAGGVISVAALAGFAVFATRRCRSSRCFWPDCRGALVTRGWGYEGRSRFTLWLGERALCLGARRCPNGYNRRV